MSFVEVAIKVPLPRTFDYKIEEQLSGLSTPILPGMRVLVPFGNQKKVAVVLGIKNSTDVPLDKIKNIIEVIDDTPILSAQHLELLSFTARYYCYPLGETIHIALPSALRQGESPDKTSINMISLTEKGAKVPSLKAKTQLNLLKQLAQSGKSSVTELKALGFSKKTIDSLIDKELITQTIEHDNQWQSVAPTVGSKPVLNKEQAVACTAINQSNGFSSFLLEGVTGSGKTEVYLQCLEEVLKRGEQALVLVPEIGLTPQTLARFKARFNCPMAIFHSNLSDKERLLYWQKARSGHAKIIIGTRSALFSASKNLGLIVIDEEHDISYKQQDSLRYSARDLACVRAKLENAHVVLGTATPSLETLNNAVMGKFKHWHLTERAGNAQAPEISIVDIRQQNMIEGIAEEVLQDIQATVDKGEQTLIFINRRGFAPSLICHDCGWVAQCHACDAKMTVHLKSNHLRCHHCQAVEPITRQCPSCHGEQITFQGVGTERLAMAMQGHFPDTAIFRIDRDTTSSKTAMPEMMDNIHQCQDAILVGTQMLAKGHHFPNVTLVIILEADSALMGIDYRASERFGQLLTQVMGRAGRAEKPGRAIIQSHFPEHPQLQKLIQFGYNRFAMDLLSERQHLGLPPFSYHALLRLESQDASQAQQILTQMQQHISAYNCQCLGPFPAALQRRAYFYRYQLLIQASQRPQLKQALSAIQQLADKLIKSHKVRFSIDVDPQDMS